MSSSPPNTISSSLSTPYHPQFSSPEADFVLSSSDGTFFRVHKFTLRTTTGYFKELFLERQESASAAAALASQSADTSNAQSTLVSRDEIPFETGQPTRILLPFLQMISGLAVNLSPPRPPPSPNTSTTLTPDPNATSEAIARHYVHILALLTLSSSRPGGWDAPGPMAQIRAALSSPWALSDPLRLYSIACTFDWAEEMKIGARGCCGDVLWFHLAEEDQEDEDDDRQMQDTDTPPNLEDDEGNVDLSSPRGAVSKEDRPPKPPTPKQILLSLSTTHLSHLLLLQRSRRDTFRRALDINAYFINAGMNDRARRCPSCNEIDSKGGGNWEWRELKHAMVAEIDRRPEGDTIVGRVGPSAYSAFGMGLMHVGGVGVLGVGNTGTGRVSIEEWQEGKMCFEARCPKEGCGKLKYDRVQVMRVIRECLEGLPGDL